MESAQTIMQDSTMSVFLKQKSTLFHLSQSEVVLHGIGNLHDILPAFFLSPSDFAVELFFPPYDTEKQLRIVFEQF